MRGADACYNAPHDGAHRFIPTCVGQIINDPSPAFYDAVHPHMRGADTRRKGDMLSAIRFIPTCVGQMKLPRITSQTTLRFIPTCVGQMRTVSALRICYQRFIPTCVGQMSPVMPSCCLIIGSSPHAWGRCVGQSGATDCGPVHPHMRGADT